LFVSKWDQFGRLRGLYSTWTVAVGVLPLFDQVVGEALLLGFFDPVVGEALLLGFFELRGDLFDPKVVGFFELRGYAFDAKVVGVAMCLIWQGWRGKFCRVNFTCCPCRDAVAAGVIVCHRANPFSRRSAREPLPRHRALAVCASFLAR
jgi:hypothetical protein